LANFYAAFPICCDSYTVQYRSQQNFSRHAQSVVTNGLSINNHSNAVMYLVCPLASIQRQQFRRPDREESIVRCATKEAYEMFRDVTGWFSTCGNCSRKNVRKGQDRMWDSGYGYKGIKQFHNWPSTCLMCQQEVWDISTVSLIDSEGDSNKHNQRL
jgi:hypothetical protein